MMSKETPQERYRKKNIVSKMFFLNRQTDTDILEKLAEVPNQSGYVKELIREDIKKNDNET